MLNLEALAKAVEVAGVLKLPVEAQVTQTAVVPLLVGHLALVEQVVSAGTQAVVAVVAVGMAVAVEDLTTTAAVRMAVAEVVDLPMQEETSL